MCRLLKTDLQLGRTDSEEVLQERLKTYEAIRFGKYEVAPNQTSEFGGYLSTLKEQLLGLLTSGGWHGGLVAVVAQAIAAYYISKEQSDQQVSTASQGAQCAKVLRFGEILVIPSSDLLVGDIVQLEAGDFIPADGIVLEASSFAVNTSAITGESYPVAISPAYDEATTDQFKVFEMTVVQAGTAKVLVTAVSPNTFVRGILQLIGPS